MTEDVQTEQQEPQQRIKSVTVYWTKDRVEDYDDVTGFDVDHKLGIPRMSIRNSTGRISNINLNNVESWDVELEYVQ